MEKENFVSGNEASFEIETLQDWRLEAGANQSQPELPGGGGCSNTSSNCNTGGAQ